MSDCDYGDYDEEDVDAFIEDQPSEEQIEIEFAIFVSDNLERLKRLADFSGRPINDLKEELVEWARKELKKVIRKRMREHPLVMLD